MNQYIYIYYFLKCAFDFFYMVSNHFLNYSFQMKFYEEIKCLYFNWVILSCNEQFNCLSDFYTELFYHKVFKSNYTASVLYNFKKFS